MQMNHKNVLIIGGGIAGVSAALELNRLGIGVELVERKDTLGGHARQLTCKATEKCVACGACVAVEKLGKIAAGSGIQVHLQSRITKAAKPDRFIVDIAHQNGSNHEAEADAVIIASGFSPFDPIHKPYGYGRFKNVITSLELESMLREQGRVKRPSDRKVPRKIAFIQCVGSRDEKTNHLWCSKVCCGAAIRMANLIQYRQPEMETTLFYIDIQSFGKDFGSFFNRTKESFRFIRAIPGDVLDAEDDQLLVSYFDSASGESKEERFDLLILSVGMMPGKDLSDLTALFHMETWDTGFLNTAHPAAGSELDGVFAAGTVLGPMSISESIASAGNAAWDVAKYLDLV